MTDNQLRIGWNFPGTFQRLGLHVGAILAWMKVYRLPSPTMSVGTSAGAIILACCTPLNRKNLHRVAKVIGDLGKDQIYQLSPDLKKAAAHLMAAGAAVLISLVFGLFLTSPWALTLFLASISFGVWLIRRAMRIFFRSESPLDNTPLRDLLLEQLNFQALFSAESPEFRVIAADVATPKALVFSTHDAWKTDPEDKAHRERFVDAILGSAALPGRFPLRAVDGSVLRDAEVWSDFPIHQFRGQCDVVFRFDYWEPLQPSSDPKHWIGDLFRCFDVMRDKNTKEKMARYELERTQDPTLPRVVYLRVSKELLSEIPDLAVYSFKPGQLWRSIRLGYRIIRENLPLIRQELEMGSG
jgi:predicted acylesterase/phospholipase RssA